MLSISSSSAVYASKRSFQFVDDDKSTHDADIYFVVDCDFGENREENDLTFEDDIRSALRPLLRRKTMAVTKFQVMLNNLLLK